MGNSAEEPGTNGRTILINFVLDMSGSMEAIRQSTISGFNEFKNDQAREDGEAFFTLTLFDTEFITVCDAVPVREVLDLTMQTYAPRGMTALYDAIGRTMVSTDAFVAANKPDQVLFVIMTDGEENSSKEYSRERIFQMIQDRQNLAGYEFIYLGANQDAYAVGADMGLRQGRMLTYAASPAEAQETMSRASRNVRAYRRAECAQRASFFDAATERLGEIEPEAWARMSDKERREFLDGDAGGATGSQADA